MLVYMRYKFIAVMFRMPNTVKTSRNNINSVKNILDTELRIYNRGVRLCNVKACIEFVYFTPQRKHVGRG